MTNPDFQQELKDKIKAGVKPSNLKKLKRSKSADDVGVKGQENLIENNPPTQLLQDQLQEKQKEVESLRSKLELTHQQLTATTQELDNSLQARYQALKQFGIIYDKLQLVKQELNENVDQASDELLDQDEIIAKLRTNHQKARTRIQELEKDLNLAQRLAELRKTP
jgi:chromosome segregation ATPase